MTRKIPEKMAENTAANRVAINVHDRNFAIVLEAQNPNCREQLK
jgi:hypothetical protein